MLECPKYIFIRDKFQLLFEKVVLESLEPFHDDHQVDMSLYLTEGVALRHSGE